MMKHPWSFRVLGGLSVVSALFICSNTALAQAPLDKLCVMPDHKIKRNYRDCEKDGGQVGTFEETNTRPVTSEIKSNKKTKVTGAAIAEPAKLPAIALTAPNPNTCVDGWNRHLAIGDSFNDLNFLNTASCNAALAKGAQFSWSRDRVAVNDQWSAKGAVAQQFVWISPRDSVPDSGAYLNMLAIAPTVSFQRVTNSSSKLSAQNANVLSYGVSSEALVDRVADFWQVYVRGRANINADFDGIAHSWSTTGEFQALSDRYGIGRNFAVGSLGYFWVIPFVRAQYFHRESASILDPIFAFRNDVFRAGPVVSFNFVPQDEANVDPNKPAQAPKWLFNVTYSWYKDFLSSRTYYHFNPSLSYNFTDNIGVTLGYEVGQIDQTGKKIDMATIGLSVKN
jgi:hypothetical protein